MRGRSRIRISDVRVNLAAPPAFCACGYEFEVCSPAPVNGTPSHAVPEEGSITVCLKCARVYVFDAALSVQLIRLEDLPPEPRQEVRRLVDAIHRLRGIPS